MDLNDMYRLAKSNLDFLCQYWDNEGPKKSGLEIARQRLKECRQERDALVQFKRNGFK
jgi:hypothetical protein